MKLTDLEPQFLKIVDEKNYRHVDLIAEADGVMFLCPKCYMQKGFTRVGVHSILCWRPHVPQTHRPTPGRWEFTGTGYDDLSLVAGSSGVKLPDEGCAAHFHVRNGEITDC
jgi:hypothetical protein